jgi:hypothetical protein
MFVFMSYLNTLAVWIMRNKTYHSAYKDIELNPPHRNASPNRETLLNYNYCVFGHHTWPSFLFKTQLSGERILSPSSGKDIFSWAQLLMSKNTIVVLIYHRYKILEPGYGSRYSDWLRAGRQRGWSSSPGRVKYFLFCAASRPALGLTQLPIQWVLRALSLGVKRPGRETDHSHPTSAEVKKMWIHFPIRLHGVVLN